MIYLIVLAVLKRTLIASEPFSENYYRTYIVLAGLKAISGMATDFGDISETMILAHPYKRSFDWFFKLRGSPKILFDKFQFFDEMIALSDGSRVFYEFGVWMGVSFGYLMKYFGMGSAS